MEEGKRVRLKIKGSSRNHKNEKRITLQKENLSSSREEFAFRDSSIKDRVGTSGNNSKNRSRKESVLRSLTVQKFQQDNCFNISI